MEILCWEYNEYLSKEERLEVERFEDERSFTANPDIKKCICGYVFMAEPGQVIYGYKDDTGKPISDEAAEHMSINRVNCPQCKQIFCSNCKKAPYHLGKTCDQNNAY